MMLDIETPALLLSRDVMERNLKHMAERARHLGVSLRPHIKTHKCLELGRRQLAHGAKGITVSTLFEAQAFALAGFTDLTWAFPLDLSHVRHVQQIAQDGGATVRVILDDLETARRRRRWRAAACMSGSRWTVAITAPVSTPPPATGWRWLGNLARNAGSPSTVF